MDNLEQKVTEKYLDETLIPLIEKYENVRKEWKKKGGKGVRKGLTGKEAKELRTYLKNAKVILQKLKEQGVDLRLAFAPLVASHLFVKSGPVPVSVPSNVVSKELSLWRPGRKGA